MSKFKDKIIWITGAGTGIGRAVAHMYAAEGATMVLFGRREAVLQGVQEEVISHGGHADIMAVDVADRAAVDRAAKELLGRHGRVDILVNNAGVNVQERRLESLSPEDWDLLINVNLTGAYNMIHAVLPPMRKQQGGLVVNVSSMAGKQVSGLSGAAYTASKHGMNGLSHSINVEEWQHNIRATVICPGEVNTDIIDKRPVKVEAEDRERMMQPEDLAEAVRFVSLMHPRTTVTEMLMLPTYKRQFKPGERD